MKTILVCPDEFLAVRSVTSAMPPVAVNILGKPLIVYWIEHLVAKGVQEILILSSDRPDKIREIVHDGYPWGIKIDLLPQRAQLTRREVRKKFMTEGTGWMAPPYDLVEISGLPNGSEQCLFDSFQHFFTGVRCWIPHATQNRVNMKQTKPGIWVSTRSRVSKTAILKTPCWIGDHVRIADGAVIGPMAILEENVAVGKEAVISNSIIQNDTYIGELTNVQDSIVTGNILVNWKTNSSVAIPDSFLISNLRLPSRPRSAVGIVSRSIAFFVAVLTSPFVLPYAFLSFIRATNLFNKSIAVLGNQSGYVTYYQLREAKGYFARWPQLWNVMRGEFAWFGNRPLSVREATALAAEFENLWLQAPPGIFSQADAAGCWTHQSDEATGHACFYSAQRSWKLNYSILKGVFANWRRATKEATPAVEGGTIKDKWFALRRVVSDFLSI